MHSASIFSGQPHCQVVEPNDRHWAIFKNLCITTKTRGFRVSDAWFAALAVDWGCEWITLDRDYARVSGSGMASSDRK